MTNPMPQDPAPSSALTRRSFLAAGAASAAGAAYPAGTGRAGPDAALPHPAASGEAGRELLDLSTLPNYCAHEHWGSIPCLTTPEDHFLADRQQGTTPLHDAGLFDLLLDPYFSGALGAAGAGGGTRDKLAGQAGATDFAALAKDSPSRALAVLRPALRPHQLTGTYQAIRRGILHLYGVDVSAAEPRAIDTLDAAIRANYRRIFEWHREVMDRVHFSGLIRPVHPEFYQRRQSAQTAAAESAFTRTIMRIDELLECWRKNHPQRARLVEATGIEPRSASSWRNFLDRIFELAAGASSTGIKQLQAYRRPLEFLPRADSEVAWSGELTPGEIRVFQDWVAHECFKRAHERGWPQQIHVGTHNLTQSSPMPLEAVATRYPRMKLVLIHCWPFLDEAGWLAKYHSNVYLDTCWLPVLNPEFFRAALGNWLNYVPTHKIMCSHDSTSIEMAVGSMLFTREILGQSLVEKTAGLGISTKDLLALATDLLHNNAIAVYGAAVRS